MTVLNEKEVLESWFQSIAAQSLKPDEIIIVDGGSTDGTWEFLQSQKSGFSSIKLFQKKGNIAAGRNYAISQAQGEIIVVTDAGCRYEKNWLAELVKPLLNREVQFSTTAFAPWFKPTDTALIYGIAAVTTPAPFEFKKDWIPSSRSIALFKSLWHSVGGYPEWLPICEDVVFDFKLKKKGIRFAYIRIPLVWWRPRTTLTSYFLQLFKYTRSDGHAKLFLLRQCIRYAVYGGSIGLVALAIQLHSFLPLLLMVVGFISYFLKFWRRWWNYAQRFSFIKKLVGCLAVAGLVVYGDSAKMIGWPVGVYERITKKIVFQRY